MKAVQVMFDEQLLCRLDHAEEVKSDGRSAVVRRATQRYLDALEQASIDAAYQRGYGDQPGLGPEFEDWQAQGRWPQD